MEYNFKETEQKWQKRWAGEDKEWSDKKTFRAENNSSKPKYYVLDMFPYPSGAGLHVGHPLGYIASDIIARYKRLKGFNVLHPMGYDSFGLPAEQYAIQTGQHPAITTEQNIKRYREQLDKMGFSFDWDREVRTSDPGYYKWTQWIFIQLFNAWYNPETNKAEPISSLIRKLETDNRHADTKWSDLNGKQKSDVLMNYRLAYLSEAWVNWCPALGTVLANEEVRDGVSERGGHPVERKLMPQWSLRITAYADRLLNDLDTVDWSESLKESQRNWIGRSEGTSLRFSLTPNPSPIALATPFSFGEGGRDEAFIEVFTTRPDTIFGVSFLTLAPEHELVEKITTPENKKAVDEYVTCSKNRSERERQADVKKITGQFTGTYAIHPFSGKKIPVWIGDYVLAGYGTGAVMAVPAHDTRDYAFANHFNLPKPIVILPPSEWDFNKEAYDAKEGKLINSDFLDGLEVKDAIKKAISEIEKKGLGKGKINYRLRDAVFGRQRYWGEPIPVYYKDGIPHVLNESELPLVLPEVDKYLPTETGEPPLARAAFTWKHEGKYEYEKTTMPGWAGSSWYYLRYMDPKNENEFASREAVNYWKDIDLYIGGAEHATGHLLYVRFWTKFLKDLGYISIDEPAKKLINQGMIQGMSMFVRIVNLNTSKSKPDLKGFQNLIDGKQNESVVYIGEKDDEFVQKNEAKTNNIETLMYSFANPSMPFSLGTRIPLNYVTFESGNYYLSEKNLEDLKEEYPSFENYRFATFSEINDIYKKIYSKELDENYKINFNPGKIELLPEVEKMSKSKYNVVNPDDIIQQYGADCLRLYEMFLGPLDQHKPWNTNGITGVSGFLRKLWRLYHSPDWNASPLRRRGAGGEAISDEPPTKPELKSLHKTIKKITEDIERFSFNTSVSNFMICVNELTDLKCNKRAILEPLAIIISPYAPHIAEELWSLMGHKESISYEKFPDFNEQYLEETSFNYPVSVNGKTKFFHELDLSLSRENIEKEVMALEQTQKYLEGKTPKKVIVVPNKIVNIVV